MDWLPPPDDPKAAKSLIWSKTLRIAHHLNVETSALLINTGRWLQWYRLLCKWWRWRSLSVHCAISWVAVGKINHHSKVETIFMTIDWLTTDGSLMYTNVTNPWSILPLFVPDKLYRWPCYFFGIWFFILWGGWKCIFMPFSWFFLKIFLPCLLLSLLNQPQWKI